MSFRPHRYFNRISDIDIRQDLLDCGITCVLLDIDNTIRSREDGLVPADVLAWLEEARTAGVKLCMLSNNWHANVHDLSRELGIPVVGKACKPLPHGYVAALSMMGAKARETALAGDQLFTDVLGAKLVGIRSFLVEPLAQKDLAHTLVLRQVQSRLLGGMEPEGSKGTAAAQPVICEAGEHAAEAGGCHE